MLLIKTRFIPLLQLGNLVLPFRQVLLHKDTPKAIHQGTEMQGVTQVKNNIKRNLSTTQASFEA